MRRNRKSITQPISSNRLIGLESNQNGVKFEDELLSPQSLSHDRQKLKENSSDKGVQKINIE